MVVFLLSLAGFPTFPSLVFLSGCASAIHLGTSRVMDLVSPGPDVFLGIGMPGSWTGGPADSPAGSFFRVLAGPADSPNQNCAQRARPDSVHGLGGGVAWANGPGQLQAGCLVCPGARPEAQKARPAPGRPFACLWARPRAQRARPDEIIENHRKSSKIIETRKSSKLKNSVFHS